MNGDEGADPNVADLNAVRIYALAAAGVSLPSVADPVISDAKLTVWMAGANKGKASIDFTVSGLEADDHYNLGLSATNQETGNPMSLYWLTLDETTLKSRGYCETRDGKTVLAAAYDAAQAKMGGDWRLPTADDFRALIANCDVQYIANREVNGVPMGVGGWLFTGRDGFSACSVFFPVCGYGYNEDLRTGQSWYWAATPNGAFYADTLFVKNTGNQVDVGTSTRVIGSLVRGVMPASSGAATISETMASELDYGGVLMNDGEKDFIVPNDWLDAMGVRVEGDTAETLAAKVQDVGENGVKVWESYVAGLDPNDPDSKFKGADVSFDGDFIVVTPSPLVPNRIYTPLFRMSETDDVWTLGDDVASGGTRRPA